MGRAVNGGDTITQWPSEHSGHASFAGRVDHTHDRDPLPESTKLDAVIGFVVGGAIGAMGIAIAYLVYARWFAGAL